MRHRVDRLGRYPDPHRITWDMTDSSARGRSIAIIVVIVAIIFGVGSVHVAGASVASRFFASLRIARPNAVTAPSVAPGATTRRLQIVVMGIVAETSAVPVDEPDVPVPTPDSAARIAGFRPRLLRARTDAPQLTVVGAHAERARVDRAQLRTLLAEAGRRAVSVPASVDGATIELSVPRGVRAEYGHCPAPIANTIQNQINGLPPPSVDNGDCVIFGETPLAASLAPAALDTNAVLAIALELTGMSPNQARDFQQLFSWRAALAPPRFMRSYDVVTVGGSRAMLMTTGGRRGPTYVLAWVDGGTVYTVTGYGSSADAVPLASSAT
jgi:hypothetical protein